MKRGSFNLIRWTKSGRQDVVRRIALHEAIRLAEEHSRQDVFNLGSVRRLPDGKLVGEALRGEFRFA